MGQVQLKQEIKMNTQAASPKPQAFTLIELLVVVTIIVVLLALLVPAMDRAIYQAELATCGARLKSFGTGVTVYAMDFGRHYPYRPWVFAGGWRPNHLWNRVSGAFDKDERPLIRPYVAGINKQVQCPLNQEMNLDEQAGGANAASESNQAWGSYYLLYGWGYKGGGVVEKAMRKIGDRFEYTDAGDGSQPPVVNSFDILASDYEMYDLNTYPNTVGSHPDQGSNAVMFQYVLDNQSTVTGDDLPGTNITISRWAARSMRAPIDMNFARADGSVDRLNDVVFETKAGTPAPGTGTPLDTVNPPKTSGIADERMATILETSNKSGTFYTHLPPAN